MNRMILIKRAFLFSICISLSMYCSTVSAQETFPPGSKLPSFNLELPRSSPINAYLRIKESPNFSLSQIPAKLIVLEFFSVFCPVCQMNAPIMNRLYQTIRSDKTLDKDIKVLGVALIGKPNELALYKGKYSVAFPLFDDPKGEIKDRTKLDFVPLTLVMDPNGKIIMSHPGLLKNLDAFLIELRKTHKAL